ncbi:MAG: tetratricopeptide repeat protein [Candidatus Marinimicrobia bacterium]|nr:tetratricopeptide repeat protein [Candidatus Neomarinimicrobiota bacterium]
MSNTNLQKFLEAVSDLAGERCGQAFTNEMTSLLAERDRLLKSSWQEVDASVISTEDRKKLLKEVDFDTFTSRAANFLDKKAYPLFLFNVANTGIRFGELTKAKRLLTAIVAKYTASLDKLIVARCHKNLGQIAFYQNDLKSAETSLKTSLRLFKSINSHDGIASTHNALGTVLIEMGKPEAGQKEFNEAKAIAEKHKLDQTLSSVLMNLGNVASILGEWDEALANYQSALTGLKNQEAHQLKAKLNLNLASVYLKQGNFPKAESLVKEGNRFSEKGNLRYERAVSYLIEAEIACRKRIYSTGSALAITAFHLFSEMGDRHGLAEVYRVLGMINRDSEHFDQALSYFENSRRINTELGSHLNLGETLYEMGQLHQTTGNKRKAGKAFRDAIASYKRVNAKSRQLEAEIALSNL